MNAVVIAASFMFINGLKARQSVCRNLCLIKRNKGLLSIKSTRADCRRQVAIDSGVGGRNMNPVMTHAAWCFQIRDKNPLFALERRKHSHRVCISLS